MEEIDERETQININLNFQNGVAIFTKMRYYLINYFITALVSALALGMGAQMAAALFKEKTFLEKNFFEIIISVDMIAIMVGKIAANYYIGKQLLTQTMF